MEIEQLTALFGAFEEGTDGAQVALVTQEQALNLTAAPVVDGKAHRVHAQRMVAQKVPAKVHLF